MIVHVLPPNSLLSKLKISSPNSLNLLAENPKSFSFSIRCLFLYLKSLSLSEQWVFLLDQWVSASNQWVLLDQ